MNIAPLLTSMSEHYCTPPKIITPMRRVLIPPSSGRRLLDPSSNGASIVGAHMTADGSPGSNGLDIRWADAEVWYENPPYGKKIDDHVAKQCYWGREIGVPGISLLPARVDTKWFRRIWTSADAVLFIDGRLTFWLPIPINEKDATPVENGEPHYLRRWFPTCTDSTLPAPFRSLEPGFAVGPELGKNGKPQPAPFPSAVAFWGEKDESPDPVDLAKMRGWEDAIDALEQEGDDAAADHLRAHRPHTLEDLLGDPGAASEHPITVREFARHFLPLGTLVVRQGHGAGVWRK